MYVCYADFSILDGNPLLRFFLFYVEIRKCTFLYYTFALLTATREIVRPTFSVSFGILWSGLSQ